MQNRNQVYVIGGSEAEFHAIKESLIQKAQIESIQINFSHLPAGIKEESFPLYTNNVIIFTCDGIEKLTKKAAKFLREFAEKVICRIYFIDFGNPISKDKLELIEEYIQRNKDHNLSMISDKVIQFLKECKDLAWLNNKLGIRDIICLWSFKFLKWFFLISYGVALIYAIIIIYPYFSDSTPFWTDLLSNPYVVTMGTFFGLFFCAHAIITIIRNSIFYNVVGKRVNLEFFIGIIFFMFATGLVFYSVIQIDKSYNRILISSGLAFFLHWFYVYSLKIRAECTSLSQIQNNISERNDGFHKREELAKIIGDYPLMSSAFPLFEKKSRNIYLSNMHKSDWSYNEAGKLHDELESIIKKNKNSKKKNDVFLDRSSIEQGELWRRYLLRRLSECTEFVALLDGDYTEKSEWAFAESAYAVQLRKTIGKPKILLVFENEESLNKVRNSTLGKLYRDIFEIDNDSQLGSGILTKKELTALDIIKALENIKPMQLL